MKRLFVCAVSFVFFMVTLAALAGVTMSDIFRWGLLRNTDILPVGSTITYMTGGVLRVVEGYDQTDTNRLRLIVSDPLVDGLTAVLSNGVYESAAVSIDGGNVTAVFTNDWILTYTPPPAAAYAWRVSHGVLTEGTNVVGQSTNYYAAAGFGPTNAGDYGSVSVTATGTSFVVAAYTNWTFEVTNGVDVGAVTNLTLLNAVDTNALAVYLTFVHTNWATGFFCLTNSAGTNGNVWGASNLLDAADDLLTGVAPTGGVAAGSAWAGYRRWVSRVTNDFFAAETDEAALAALAAYAAYWPPNATASSWFTFTTNSGAITITGYNIAGGTDVVIPDYINGLPVTEIGGSAFRESGVTSIGGAGNVVTVGGAAFYDCDTLASVSLPQAQTVGASAFSYCISLTSVSLPQATSIGDGAFRSCTSLTAVRMGRNAPAEAAGVFAGITPPTVYVTDPQATGWGATWNGAPVVRPPLYADAVYQAGELVATTGHVAQAIASQLPGIVYSNAVSQMVVWTNAAGAVTNMAVCEGGTWKTNAFGAGEPLPDGIVTNGMGGPLTLGGVKLDTNKIEFTNDDGSTAVYQSGGSLVFRSILGQRIYFFNGSSHITGAFDPLGFLLFGNRSLLLGDNSEAGLSYNGGNLEINPRRSGSGDVRVTAGNLTVVNTNTAAEVRSTGGYIIGPTISGKQAHIFTDGTNCFFVNVNSVTNGVSVPYTDWTGTVTPQNGTATVAYAHGNMPVLVVPDGGGTTYVTVATGTYAATSGVSRVSLSIWAGTNAIELVTNEVDYVSAPDIPTNGWGTILFRRVSDGRWKGVGL